MTAAKRVLLCSALLLAGAWAEAASAAGDVEQFGLKWIEMGAKPGDCRVLADGATSKPLVNPDYPNVYGVHGADPNGCPKMLDAKIQIAPYDRYEVRDQAIRFYAPWGRTYISRFYPQMEHWGYGRKFLFQWIPGKS